MRTAVVEVGTASLRVVVAEATDGGGVRVLADHRVVLGLQRAVRRDGHLGEGLLQLVEETARRLREVGFRAGASVTMGCLSAGLADAADLEELRRRTAAAIRGEVTVATPEEEARLLAAAVLRGTTVALPSVLLDLGDHELRAIGLGRDGAPGAVVATRAGTRDLLPVGAVDPYHPAVRGRLRWRLEELLAELPTPPQAVAWPVVTGRVVDALGRAVEVRRRSGGRPSAAGLRISRAELDAFERELMMAGQTQRMLLPAIDPAEVDLVALAVVLVAAIADRLGAEGVVVSPGRTLDGWVLRALETPVVVGTVGPVSS
jgi:exopolyphosphatase / guanosine-5'-triphosphate,3'-diphosphate pyrophosphatase